MRKLVCFLFLLCLVMLSAPAIRGLEEPSNPKAVFESPGKASRSPALIAVPGLVFVVWEEEVDPGNTDIFYSYSVNEGQSFSEPKPVASTAGISQEPAIVFRDGVIYAAWSEGIPGSNKEIWLATQADLDQQFGEPQNISSNEGESKQPALAISNTTLFIAWADNTRDPRANPEGDFEILLRASPDGSPFTSAVNVSYTTGPSLAPALASDGDNLFVAWEEGSGASEVLFRQSALFSSPLNISCSPYQASGKPAITASLNEVYVVWEEAVEGKMEIFLSKATGAGIPFSTPTFSNPNNLSHTPTTESKAPTIIVDSQGNIFISWQEAQRPSSTSSVRFDTDILLLTSLAPFISPYNVSNSPDRASSSPAIATDGLNLYVVWEEETAPGKPDIYFRKLALFP